MNYELTKKYFKVVDETINYKASIIMIVIGVILLLFIGSAPVIGIIGIALAAIGIYLIVSKKKKIEEEKSSIPSDEQYDSEVTKCLNGIKERALSSLGVDEDEVKEIEPISFDGYVFDGANNFKVGKDNLFRTDKYESVWLFFSQNEVHCYTYRFDTLNQNLRPTDKTSLYFYKDIVSADTESETKKVKGKEVNYEYFKLTTAGGTALTVSLRDVQGAQKSINAMRALLREKKQG